MRNYSQMILEEKYKNNRALLYDALQYAIEECLADKNKADFIAVVTAFTEQIDWK